MKSNCENIVIVSPHPDDAFISSAGFVIKNIDKFNFTIVCITSKDIKPSSEIRIKEEKEAWSRISDQIDVIFFDKGTDTRLGSSQKEIIAFIEDIVSRLSPKIVFIPYYLDTHQDHRTVSESCLAACRYMSNILFYETPSTFNFYPTMYVKMEEHVINKKLECASSYSSQVLGVNEVYSITLPELIKSQALGNGAKSRVCKFAEGFSSHKYFLDY